MARSDSLRTLARITELYSSAEGMSDQTMFEAMPGGKRFRNAMDAGSFATDETARTGGAEFWMRVILLCCFRAAVTRQIDGPEQQSFRDGLQWRN